MNISTSQIQPVTRNSLILQLPIYRQQSLNFSAAGSRQMRQKHQSAMESPNKQTKKQLQLQLTRQRLILKAWRFHQWYHQNRQQIKRHSQSQQIVRETTNVMTLLLKVLHRFDHQHNNKERLQHQQNHRSHSDDALCAYNVLAHERCQQIAIVEVFQSSSS